MRCTMDKKAAYEKVEAALSEKRFAHTKGCISEAVKLSQKWGADVDSAENAALLHDITKHFDRVQQLNLCSAYGIIIDDVAKTEWKILHALTGSEVAKREYGASENECRAIRYHTTGHPDMKLLDKIIYLADFIEPTRDFDGVEELRRLAYEDVDDAMIAALSMSIREVLDSGRLLHHDTVDTRNKLCLMKRKI